MMDFSMSTKLISSRIQAMDLDNVAKIIGYLLLLGHGEDNMARLALAPDHLFHPVVLKAKDELLSLTSKPVSTPISPSIIPSAAAYALFSPVSSRPQATVRVPSACWDPQLVSKQNTMPFGFSDPTEELRNHARLLSLEDQIEPINSGMSGYSDECYFRDTALGGSLSPGPGRRFSTSEFPVKICHYFSKGFCKHGSTCRYYHGQAVPDSYSQLYGNDGMIDDHISPMSLEKLEGEIVELLRSRRGTPISIASLPMMYYEKYGKSLQAEGYLTESQRHGKAGYSLTKLLARLGSSIRLIDRPHGQHAIILAEDSLKYMDHRNDRGDPGPIVSGSRQIYLTFPADSTFSEDDVSNYFNTFGPVADVRIPCQPKRMFGFVTFVHTDTVAMILSRVNPHFVCGARVLVKPYREKPKLAERKYQERMEPAENYSAHFSDMEPDFHSMSRLYNNSRWLRKKLQEEQEFALELERSRLAQLYFTQKQAASQPYSGYVMDGQMTSEELDADNFNILPAEDKPKHIGSNYTDQDCQGLDLPDSPFATSIASGISAVI